MMVHNALMSFPLEAATFVLLLGTDETAGDITNSNSTS
jgi:hypothetical protein